MRVDRWTYAVELVDTDGVTFFSPEFVESIDKSAH